MPYGKFKNEDCFYCNAPVGEEHILLECPEGEEARQEIKKLLHKENLELSVETLIRPHKNPELQNKIVSYINSLNVTL